MKPLVPLVIALSLLLSGCTAAAAPTRTVTVTVSPPLPSLPSADSAPWDLHAVCAAESEVQALIVWRDQQTEAGRLTSSQSAAVRQAIAVQYLQFDDRGVSSTVKTDIETLRDAAGTLEHPAIDLQAGSIERARNGIAQACQDNGLTIGVVAQGG